MIAVLKNENDDSHLRWQISCEKKGVPYCIVDLTRADYLFTIQKIKPEFCLAQPSGLLQIYKKMYDEKIYIIEKHLRIPVYPSYNEILLHENKKLLAYFLEVNNIPHPNTFVSYNREEVESYLSNTSYPIVAKTSLGATGSGVKIIRSHCEALEYTNKSFGNGISRRFGPNKKTGTPADWFLKTIKTPSYFLKKMEQYRQRARDVQYGYVIFQEYIIHEYEWRCVKIGESYFAYKKLKEDGMASGSKKFEYGPPPLELLDFTRELCRDHNFRFMAIDLFHINTSILVNELQTVFGHKNPYICRVDDKIGRYIFNNERWIFEEGNFNSNESYDLRLNTALNIFENSKL
jgi:glutathione synthase/RimK-type ligase-like ATP-grasp enzyme